VAHGYDDREWRFTGDPSNVSGKIKEVPDLPIVTMALSRAELEVVAKDADIPRQESILDPADLIRWNDYGIGLLLQRDLKAAEKVFTLTTRIDPDFADGWVNIGRVRVMEGRAAEAQQVLQKALELNPDLAKTHYFLGLAHKIQGKYDRALEHFRQAETRYPRDRAVLNQIGRTLFLQRRFAESVPVLQRVLSIDPEDLQAHYNLMLAHRALGNHEQSRREQQLYLRFKADESAQSIAGPYLRDHPEDNNERQAIHEHSSYPLDRIVSKKAANRADRSPQ
jgi:tetratricopeptide (TPR) repeat protein